MLKSANEGEGEGEGRVRVRVEGEGKGEVRVRDCYYKKKKQGKYNSCATIELWMHAGVC